MIISDYAQRLAAVEVLRSPRPVQQFTQRASGPPRVVRTDMQCELFAEVCPLQHEHGIEVERLSGGKERRQIVRRGNLFADVDGDELKLRRVQSEGIGQHRVLRTLEDASDRDQGQLLIDAAQGRGDGCGGLRRRVQMVCDERREIPVRLDEGSTEQTPQRREGFPHVLRCIAQVVGRA